MVVGLGVGVGVNALLGQGGDDEVEEAQGLVQGELASAKLITVDGLDFAEIIKNMFENKIKNAIVFSLFWPYVYAECRNVLS